MCRRAVYPNNDLFIYVNIVWRTCDVCDVNPFTNVFFVDIGPEYLDEIKKLNKMKYMQHMDIKKMSASRVLSFPETYLMLLRAISSAL